MVKAIAALLAKTNRTRNKIYNVKKDVKFYCTIVNINLNIWYNIHISPIFWNFFLCFFVTFTSLNIYFLIVVQKLVSEFWAKWSSQWSTIILITQLSDTPRKTLSDVGRRATSKSKVAKVIPFCKHKLILCNCLIMNRLR